MTDAVARPVKASTKAVSTLPTVVAARIVSVLARYEPALLARLVEVGVVDRAFVDDPANASPVTASPLEMLERTLAALLERRPSLLPALGMSAIEVIAAAHERSDDSDAADHSAVVVFTDLAGFSRYTARHGDDAAARLLAEHYRTAGRIVRSRRGRVVKRLGDGLMLTFRNPLDAMRAVSELREVTTNPLPLRAGAHLGPVIRHGRDIFGNTVNVAARIAGLGRPGEILISTALADDLRHRDTAVQVGRCRRRGAAPDGGRFAVHPLQSA